MTFGSRIAALFMAPFLAVSAWFGGHFSPQPVIPSVGGPVACTMEAMRCPDGSYVGRVPPSCNFASCPTPVATSTPAAAVHITSLTPSSGEVGTLVTVHGSKFTADNTVHFGSGVVMHVASTDGATLTFTVPSALNPACYPRCLIVSRKTTPGLYPISIQNSNGMSNALRFTVTSTNTNTPVRLYAISPPAGPTGTVVSITGFGFTNDNTILMDGLVAARNVPITSSIAIACTTSPSCHGGINQTIEFTIPDSLSPNCPPGSMCPMFLRQMTPGTYAITVQNSNGTSGTLKFVVTDNTSGGSSLSISGLDAPVSLALGQTGMWTVHASASSDAGTLHYSVTWGDEVNAASGIMESAPTTIQTATTFTHAYQRSGSYTATFTVSDDSGHSAQTSTTVTVTPLY